MPNPALAPERWQHEIDENKTGWAAPTPGSASAFGGDSSGGQPVDASTAGSRMTVGGTATATGVLLVLLLVTGYFGWGQVTQTQTVVQTTQGPQTQISTDFPGWIFAPMLAAFVLGIVTAFKPKIARFTAPLYALGYGFALGAISHMFNLQYDGIVLQAVAATLAVFTVMFFLYATRIIKVTKKFALVVMAATGGIFLMYMVAFVGSLFGADLYFWDNPSPLGIIISVGIVIVAALNLALDFAFIERATESGAPKYMEWYGAFGLTVTLIWLYLSILRVLALTRN